MNPGDKITDSMFNGAGRQVVGINRYNQLVDCNRAHSVHALPIGAEPGSLVRLRKGWTAQRIMEVSVPECLYGSIAPSLYKEVYLRLCYGPYDWSNKISSYRTLMDVVHITKEDIEDHIKICGNNIKCYWPYEFHHASHRMICKHDPRTKTQEAKEEEIKMARKQQLYQWASGKGTDGSMNFGTLLSENSDGDFVLEMKGDSKAIVVMPKDQVEKVMPYTVKVVGLSTEVHLNRHMKTKKGSVKKGDTILLELDGDVTLATVSEIDTKQDAPNLRTLRGRILASVPITVAKDD